MTGNSALKATHKIAGTYKNLVKKEHTLLPRS